MRYIDIMLTESSLLLIIIDEENLNNLTKHVIGNLLHALKSIESFNFLLFFVQFLFPLKFTDRWDKQNQIGHELCILEI